MVDRIRCDARRNRSAAWRTGYDRGIQEGRAAGREDYTRRQGWDLEGQRELERADSGYTPQVGTLSDYQAGYREGFRSAYRAGFAEAGGQAATVGTGSENLESGICIRL